MKPLRIVNYIGSSGATQAGVVHDELVHPFLVPGDLLAHVGGERSLAELGQEAIGQSTKPISLEEVVVLAPIETPPSIRDFISFEEHVRAVFSSMGHEIPEVFYEQPTFYFSNPGSVIGTGIDVPWPPGTAEFDFEVEVAAVVGLPGMDIPVSEAARHIAGYCIFVDWSARDLQFREMAMRLGPAKGKDTATSLGPWLVTPDELEPYRSGAGFELAMGVRVNGIEHMRSSWSSIHWSFEEMIAFASRGAKLRAGDVLGSGTVGGGCLFELRTRDEASHPWLRPGDEVTVFVEGIGEVVNTVGRATGVEP